MRYLTDRPHRDIERLFGFQPGELESVDYRAVRLRINWRKQMDRVKARRRGHGRR